MRLKFEFAPMASFDEEPFWVRHLWHWVQGPHMVIPMRNTFNSAVPSEEMMAAACGIFYGTRRDNDIPSWLYDFFVRLERNNNL